MYEYVPSRLGDDFGLSDRMEYSSCRFYQHLTILDDSYNASSGQSDEETEEYCYQDLTSIPTSRYSIISDYVYPNGDHIEAMLRQGYSRHLLAGFRRRLGRLSAWTRFCQRVRRLAQAMKSHMRKSRA